MQNASGSRAVVAAQANLSADAKGGLPELNAIKAAGNATAKKEMCAALRSSRAELNLPAASTGAAVEQAVTAWEASHTDQLVDAPEALQTDSFGFSSGGKMSGPFDFGLFMGMRRPKHHDGAAGSR